MTTLLPTQEIGSLPKPRWLLKILKDPKVPQEDKEAAKDDLALLNIRMLESTGLDFVYDGEARRVEMYEYPIERIGGFKFSGVVRAFDNEYYKKARCVDKVKYLGNYHKKEFLFVKNHASKGVKVAVTGPYTLADWSYNEFYGSRDEFILDFAEVLRPLLQDLVSLGADWIQIDEPAATTHPKEMGTFVKAINESVAGVNSKVSLHICYSGDDYRSLFPDALDLKVSQFVLEFANRDPLTLGRSSDKRRGYGALALFKEYKDSREVGLGVVDVHSDRLETPELVRDRILFAAKTLDDPGRIFVNPDCGLKTRSRDVAFSKLRSMVEGAHLARRELEKS